MTHNPWQVRGRFSVGQRAVFSSCLSDSGPRRHWVNFFPDLVPHLAGADEKNVVLRDLAPWPAKFLIIHLPQ